MKNRMKKAAAIAFVSVVAFSQAMSMDDSEVSAAYSYVKDAYSCVKDEKVATKVMNPLQQKASNAFSYAKDKAAAVAGYGRSKGVWLKDRAYQAGSQAGSFVADKAAVCKNVASSCADSAKGKVADCKNAIAFYADSAKDKAALGYLWVKVQAKDVINSGATLINEHPKFVAGVVAATVAVAGLGYWGYKKLQKTADKSMQTPNVEDAATQTS